MSKKRVFSGIQPTGNLHLGNYLGAILNWVRGQDDKDNIFCIVDLHAITVPQDPKDLQKRIIETAKIYLAAGIDPAKSSIFIQSSRPEHTELAWILNNFTYFGELKRMTQFKDKTGVQLGRLFQLPDTRTLSSYDRSQLEDIIRHIETEWKNSDTFRNQNKRKEETVSVGLFDYPVLMAADILLYNTDEVPVGDDQKQHVEICRDIAERVNKRYKEKVFVIPEPIINKESARIMSLTDPTAKMSKSDENDGSRINITDTPDAIRKKFARAVTDSGSEIKFDVVKKPGISNLLNILSSITQKSTSELEKEYASKNYGQFKADVAEAVINLFEPIQQKMAGLNDKEVTKILEDGAKKVAPTARETLERVQKTVGLGI
ncbi:MAG: tryptophan--tRNA ligase [Patescibacteria group bacterium]|nr:tryptophan--tRNA ligase [Patescibacteria group bacterium]